MRAQMKFRYMCMYMHMYMYAVRGGVCVCSVGQPYSGQACCNSSSAKIGRKRKKRPTTKADFHAIASPAVASPAVASYTVASHGTP